MTLRRTPVASGQTPEIVAVSTEDEEYEDSGPRGWFMSHGHRMKWVRNKRSKVVDILCVDDFIFNRIGAVKDPAKEVQKWRCLIEKPARCPARAATLGDQLYGPIMYEHIHLPGAKNAHTLPHGVTIKQEVVAAPVNIGVTSVGPANVQSPPPVESITKRKATPTTNKHLPAKNGRFSSIHEPRNGGQTRNTASAIPHRRVEAPPARNNSVQARPSTVVKNLEARPSKSSAQSVPDAAEVLARPAPHSFKKDVGEIIKSKDSKIAKLAKKVCEQDMEIKAYKLLLKKQLNSK